MKVILFDIDGTLITSGGAGRASLTAAMEHAFATPLEHHVDLHGRTDRWIGKQLLEQHGLENSQDNWERLIRAYLRGLPVTLREREGCVLPGVVALLERLGSDSSVHFGLLTGNVREGAQIKLSHFGLDTLIDPQGFGGFGDKHDCRNRVSADALEDARRVVGDVPLEDVWVIGDTPRDVDCARSIGVRAAAVATGGYGREELAASDPDLLLDDLLEFPIC